MNISKLNRINNFKCITLNRDFKTWGSALLSQQDSNINSFESLKTLSLEKLFNRWKSIKKLSNNKKIISLSLESILLPNTFETNLILSNYISNKTLCENLLKEEIYDLFGSSYDFKTAFTPADRSYLNANPILKILLSKYTSSPYLIRKLFDYFFNILRLFRLLRVS